MTTEKKRTRREHSGELKARILAECELPGASVARVAMAHGVNANLVHGWRKRERELQAVAASAVQAQAPRAQAHASPMPFVPLAIPATTPPVDERIQLELRRGAVTMKVSWPLSAASHCAAWVRELLQ